MANLDEIRAAIVKTIASNVTELREVNVYAGQFNLTESKKVSLNTPTALVATLSTKRLTREDKNGSKIKKISFAVYVLTDDYREYSDCENLAQKIEGVIFGNRFGLKMLAVKDVTTQNSYADALVKQSLSMWIIAFDVEISTTADNSENLEINPSKIMLGISPMTGEENKNKYIQVDRNELDKLAEKIGVQVE